MENLERKGMPLLGDPFPEVEVLTTHGVKKLPQDYKGKWFVLFSHPADFTPVCTTEFVAFQKRYEKFKALNTELIGLSIDQVFSHIKWIEWIKEKIGVEIDFPIIADDMGKVAEKLGLVHPGKGTNTVRAVFVVDDKGIIRLILYYPQEIGRNIDEILRALEALQVSDKHGVAIPAQWPESEVVGKDHVIIPPAKDVNTAKARLEAAKKGEIECFDWWLCHKKLEKK
ncbi:MAG: peroxiredoxin [Dictyoglomus sp.]|nr:peroxiredoxin [Dictyoglomus sp.]MDW8188904.1 peroxiredoxin [Dictyoglomus sp.]